jgi:hypothetical protein
VLTRDSLEMRFVHREETTQGLMLVIVLILLLLGGALRGGPIAKDGFITRVADWGWCFSFSNSPAHQKAVTRLVVGKPYR